MIYWSLYAVLFSLFFASIPMVKKNIEGTTDSVMSLGSIFSFALAFLMCILLDFPKNNSFYLLGLVSGGAGILTGMIQVKLIEKQKARVLPLQVMIQVLACFIFYAALNQGYYNEISSNPFNAFIAMIFMISLVVLSLFLRRVDFSFKLFMTVAPVSIMFAFIVAFYKVVLEEKAAGVENAILIYVLAHYLALSIFYLVKHFMAEKGIMEFSDKVVVGALEIAFLQIFGYYFFFMAVVLSNNPAYVMIFNLLIPVWIKLYSIFIKKEDDAKLNIALSMIIISGLLVIFI